MQDAFSRFPNASLSIESEGSPTPCIIVAGDPDGFRWLAYILLEMADKVDNPSASDGWHIAMSAASTPQLRLNEGWVLSLNCDPQF